MTTSDRHDDADDTEPIDRVARALQDFVNDIDDEAPVLIRGAVIAWESMRYDDDGDALFKVSYATVPNTSMASVIGILDLATDVAKSDMFGD